MNRILSLLFLMISTIYSNAQFSIQLNTGIENPYKYEYTVNQTPSIPDNMFMPQQFRFLRTKIVSAGMIYNKPLPILKDRIDINGGLGLGYMNQFVADTVISPEKDKLLFNAVHKNIFLAPEIGFRAKVYKRLYFTTGIEMFVPLYKWISSEQGLKRFDQSVSPRFYNEAYYYSFGIDVDYEKFILGIKFQNSGEVDHWVAPFFEGIFFDHNLQRWMFSIKYKI